MVEWVQTKYIRVNWVKKFSELKKKAREKKRENEIYCYESFIDQRNEIEGNKLELDISALL